MNNTIKQYVDGSLYEFMVYLQTKKALDSGTVYVRDSINYRSLDDELMPLERWKKEKNSILKKINNSVLQMPVEILLSDLEKVLEEKYARVNRRILSNENKHIKIEKNKKDKITWKLPYKKLEDKVNNPFYEKLPMHNISDVMRFVAEKTGFMQYFTHIQPKYAKTQATLENITAYAISSGTGMGKGRITEISDISASELETTEKSFIRLETLRKVNDSIVNAIAALPIFKFYNLSDYGIHSSIDGQKIESKYLTLKARFSAKHWGLSKGVVSQTLVANHVPVNSMIIGANEHESHFVFDIVHNNSSDLKIHAVSSDMHGINRVNFFLLYIFGYWFTPRLTSISKKAEKHLVSFLDVSHYKDCLIKPASKVDKKLIINEYDNIQRIVASLALKESTQSTIISKLSSYKSINPTLKAMIELDKVIMSIYMLDYVNDADLRSTVHRSLNRGEAFHQLRSAILQVSDRKFTGKTEMSLVISNECNRFLANCVIYFNACILSNLLEAYEKQGQTKMCEKIKRLSPVAWQHINLVGKFEFFANQQHLDLSTITEGLIRNLKSGFPLAA